MASKRSGGFVTRGRSLEGFALSRRYAPQARRRPMNVFRRVIGLKLLPAIIPFAMAASAMAQSEYAELPGFNYPYPISEYAFTSQGQPMHMAYMDVKPDKANGHTVVLLHGKNFCAATWEATIQALSQNGYRVIAPDQVGFCKSAKPERYQYSFQQLAANTHALLASHGIE